jgi:cytochrome c biogenesis protein CcmG, thiol:disulfide interchange protein DsbE
VVENYGESDLAKRFGVTRYPVVFVDDVLVAKPKDFGFFGKGEGPDEGRYTPLQSAASHDLFRADLARVMDLLSAGRHEDAAAAARRPEVPEIAALPAFTLTDLDGRPVAREDLAGRAVLVEFWATWCPPCRGTLGWLGELRKRYGDRLVVLALAIESDEKDVRRVASDAGSPLRWAMGTPEIARAFGDVSAMPTLLLFDGQGRRVASFFGAPPSLHGEVEAKLEPVLR